MSEYKLSYKELTERAKAGVDTSNIIFERRRELNIEKCLNVAAFNLAIGAENMLKAMLEIKCVEHREVHDYEKLSSMCYAAGIKLPSEFKSVVGLLKEYRDDTMTDSSYVVHEAEFANCFNIVERCIYLLIVEPTKSTGIRDRASMLL